MTPAIYPDLQYQSEGSLHSLFFYLIESPWIIKIFMVKFQAYYVPASVPLPVSTTLHKYSQFPSLPSNQFFWHALYPFTIVLVFTSLTYPPLLTSAPASYWSSILIFISIVFRHPKEFFLSQYNGIILSLFLYLLLILLNMIFGENCVFCKLLFLWLSSFPLYIDIDIVSLSSHLLLELGGLHTLKW